MANEKSKSAIPEPSPRFLVWSLAIGFLLLAGVLGYSLPTGYGGYRATQLVKALPAKLNEAASQIRRSRPLAEL